MSILLPIGLSGDITKKRLQTFAVLQVNSIQKVDAMKFHPFVHAAALIVITSVAGLTSAQAQDPRFIQVQEGLLDTQTGLVWGHHLVEVDRFLTGGNSTTRDFESTMLMTVLLSYDGQWTTTTYPEFSNAYYGRSDTDWRIPERDAIVEAVQAGLMQYLDISPAPGIQLLGDYLVPNVPEDEYNPWIWAGKKRISGGNAYVVDLRDGSWRQTYTSSTFWGSIPVRGGLVDSGGGKGKGPNK